MFYKKGPLKKVLCVCVSFELSVPPWAVLATETYKSLSLGDCYNTSLQKQIILTSGKS